jgi:structural maintenance of chromosome 3 (chondroitin sulfate proteoglycan 6)
LIILALSLSSGNQLFHVVVESDDVAMRCSELLVQYKLGRVSFMPLNTLKASEVTMGRKGAHGHGAILS